MSEDNDEIQQGPAVGDRVLRRLGGRIADLEIQLSMNEAMWADEIERLRKENAEQAEELERLREEPEPAAPPMDKAPTNGGSKAKQSA